MKTETIRPDFEKTGYYLAKFETNPSFKQYLIAIIGSTQITDKQLKEIRETFFSVLF